MKLHTQDQVLLADLRYQSQDSGVEQMAKTIMLVNESAGESLIQTTLEAKGYEVLSAGSGAEGLKTFRQKNIDLIIVFYLLPDLDGFTFTHTVKYLEPEIYTPIVMVTTNWTQEDRDLAFAAGAEDFLLHPVNPGDLLNRIRILLDLKDAREQAQKSARENASMKHQIEGLELETLRLTEQCNQFFEMKLKEMAAENKQPSPEEADTVITDPAESDVSCINLLSGHKDAQSSTPSESFEPEHPHGWWDLAGQRNPLKQRLLATKPRTA